MVKFDTKGGKVCLTTRCPSLVMESETERALNNQNFSSSFDRHVPCLRWAWTL